MKLYKFKSLNDLDRVLDIVVCERLYCAKYTELNDPFEGLLEIESWRKKYPNALPTILGGGYPPEHTDVGAFRNGDQKEWRVCSLSRSIEDIRMWGLYGDSFKGVSIEIEIDSENTKLHKVRYEKSLPFYNISNEGFFDPIDVLTRKVQQWRYEDEQRIITTNEFFHIKGCVTGVYLGTRVTEAHRTILSSIGITAPVRKTFLDKAKLKVHRCDDEENPIFEKT